MSEAEERPDPRDDEEQHPLESEEALREPRTIEDDDEGGSMPRPDLTPMPSDDD